MFTFGREKEKKHALTYVRSPDDAILIERLIDIVHDLLEDSGSFDSLSPILTETFVKGGTGVWEQTGSWICKLSPGSAMVAGLWLQLSSHGSAKVRLRVAAFLNQMPEETRKVLIQAFLSDKSAKVRSKTAGEISMKPRRDMMPLIIAGLAVEDDQAVRSSLEDALQACERA